MISTIDKLNAETLASEEDNVEAASEELEQTVFLDDLAEVSKSFQIHHMRCGVHTQQLAIRDSLREEHVANLISMARQIATIARTPKIDAILKRRAGKGAVFDLATRWGSTYMMIERILELKGYLVDMVNPKVTLTDCEWMQLSELEGLLRHPYIVTKKLQAEDLTPGIFLKEWRNLIFLMSQTGGLIADGIVTSMKRREPLLLENKFLLAAIYVDPMHRILLNDDQLSTGIDALFEVADRMKGLFQDEIEQAGSNIDPISSSETEEDLDFDKYLDEKEHVKRRRLEIATNSAEMDKLNIFKQDFSSACKEITVQEVIPLYPEIVNDAGLIVTALPPTQVSVERLFSALRIIRSDLRASIKEDITEAIIFSKTNM